MKKIRKILKGLFRGVIIHKELKTMKMLTACILAIFLGTVVTTTAASEVANLNYMDAATAMDEGPQDGVFDSFTIPNFGSVNNNGYTSFRTALEFDISTIPTGSVINSATLTLRAGVWEGPRQTELHGYVGDGTIQLGDFALNGLVAGTTLDPTGGQTIVFDVQSFVAGLVTNGDPIAGFNLREEPANTKNFTVMFFTMTGYHAPILSIDFTTATPVSVDIKPGSCPNPLNVKSKGVLPVAVLGTEDFDVELIDPLTIKLSREGYEEGVAPLRSDFEDVATPYDGELCDCHDLDGDGYLDLTLKFKTQELVETLGLDALAGDTILLTITGNLKENYGGAPIMGQDCVWVLEQVD